MGIVISVINNKGGTGKTTTTLNLGAAFAEKKKKILLIDLDSQCNLSSSMGINDTNEHVGKLILGEKSIQDLIIERENIDLIASTESLLDYEQRINNEPGREYILSEALQEVKQKYDYVFIDCPPSLGTLSINSLVAADFYIVPMQAENFAFIGLDKILQISEKVKKRMNPKLELGGILFLKLSAKTKFSQAIIANLDNNLLLKDKVFKTRIRQDIALMEASAFGKTIFEYAKSGRGAYDYRKLASEIIVKFNH
jgi:chromosome partitioning protein